MDIEEFQRSLKENDFGIGDSFWIDNWEFEVINNKRLQYENKKERKE